MQNKNFIVSSLLSGHQWPPLVCPRKKSNEAISQNGKVREGWKDRDADGCKFIFTLLKVAWTVIFDNQSKCQGQSYLRLVSCRNQP